MIENVDSAVAAIGVRLLDAADLVRSCGHLRHVGPCPACQRRQLARWQAQLMQVSEVPRVSGPARIAANLKRSATTS
jgi:hypothetical protein